MKRVTEDSLPTARPKGNHRQPAAQAFGTSLLSFRVFLFSGGLLFAGSYIYHCTGLPGLPEQSATD